MVTKHGFDLVKSAYRFTEISLFEPVKLAGPEGLGRKNFKIETKCNYKMGSEALVPISVPKVNSYCDMGIEALNLFLYLYTIKKDSIVQIGYCLECKR
jgi:hypothetical protein